MEATINVTVWNEFRHELNYEPAMKIYPQGIHRVIGDYLSKQRLNVTTATLDEPEHGLTDEVLNRTDVLVWWGHIAGDEVRDDIVEKIHDRILGGMGLIVLHSASQSKIFKKLMGTSCNIKWREANEKERIWILQPNHPITEGLGEYIELAEEEMYGEFFDVPAPDELIMVSWFQGGEIFRSGMTYTRGKGKIFVFRPGHETSPTYHNQEILKVISNSVHWAAPVKGTTVPVFGNVKPLEKL
ncbi:trehalose utilization protein ThuA [Paenibacillus marchantiophytorum]|uniref:Trehalose utilization protein ThuA n=1 Tax=Paenibacillus marchantiophytorum TaxID=1619310 RepID=A0ABQ2BS24_9BACL|nr:ThuA domain-containing protein [Paenibacillus marchantiophytorum]GGI44713.1 trehalose utilization protein ThuA [Paenibacillus marchantiophytorum]